MGKLVALLIAATALASARAVTFNHDIAPIVYQNCSSCHRPGEAAPFSLLTYADTAKKAKTIAKVTHSRLMPPWKAERASFEYRGERRLSEDQIALIQKWVKEGAPEGDPREKKEPPRFASGWRLGEPDLIIEMPEAFHIPADGPDIYRNIATPLGLARDQWVTAIEMRPSARAAVHHVLYFADPDGKAHSKPRQGSEPGFNGMRPGAPIALGGWAVGGQPQFLPEGLALHLPKDFDLVVQYHFHPTGKPEIEKARIALYFAKEPPARTLTRIQVPPYYSLFSGIDIPPGEKDFVIRDSYTLPVSVDAIGASVHAHYLGRKMKMTATLPDGEIQTLLLIDDWDFAWQDRYYFKEFHLLPKGTRLDAEIHWNNSADNPRNPASPPIRVTWGEQSSDEMGSISLFVAAHDESDLPILNKNYDRHRRLIARDRMLANPELALKVKKILSE